VRWSAGGVRIGMGERGGERASEKEMEYFWGEG